MTIRYTTVVIAMTLLHMCSAALDSAACSWGQNVGSLYVQAMCDSGDLETIIIPGQTTIRLSMKYWGRHAGSNKSANSSVLEATVRTFGKVTKDKPYFMGSERLLDSFTFPVAISNKTTQHKDLVVSQRPSHIEFALHQKGRGPLCTTTLKCQ
ncbi:hypothetical protein ACHHYP_09663 [Achlya hypogyna]|uniref:Secreted protein n=1 Tax=Achlya hypogyna TaxID=1202772 RepID=A0A1V9YMT1_ACHHY|nr:hypothetical protein ACHHYP_09663 [Achlya hypogyna]